MTLLPTFTSIIKPSIQFNIADLLSKHLPNNRFASAIEANHPTVAINPASADDSFAAVASLATVAAPTTASPVANSNLVPTPPFIVDPGAALSVCYPISVLLLSVDQVAYGLNRSPLASILDSDPYTLITGEDVSVSDPLDLSFPDLALPTEDCDSVSFTFQEFGTAILIFIHSRSTLKLLNILVEPTLDTFEWLHWNPLPRLTPTC